MLLPSKLIAKTNGHENNHPQVPRGSQSGEKARATRVSMLENFRRPFSLFSFFSRPRSPKMEITYQVCVGFARKKPKTKQPWLVVLSFPNCGKATTRHELVRVVSISSDRSETYPTRKQLSSDWLRMYFFVTHAITFEKPMRMKKHVQKK